MSVCILKNNYIESSYSYKHWQSLEIIGGKRDLWEWKKETLACVFIIILLWIPNESWMETQSKLEKIILGISADLN